MNFSIKSVVYIFILVQAFILTGIGVCFGEAYLPPDVLEFLESEKHGSYYPVNLVLSDQVSPSMLEQFKGLRKADRRCQVIRYLKDYARNSQRELNGALTYLAEQGHVRSQENLWIANVVAVEADMEAINQLRGFPGIRAIISDLPGPALLFHTLAEDTSWGIAAVRALEVWHDFGIDGEGVLLAILDTGVEYNHRDLAGQIWRNAGEIPWDEVDNDSNGYVDDWVGYNFTDSTGQPADDEGHGTHVGGTMVGDGTMGRFTGVAPGAKLLICKVLDKNGAGRQRHSWQAIEYAVLMGADAMNLSIGWTDANNEERSIWRTTIENAVAAGTAVIVAAGNEGGYGDAAPYNLRTPGDVPDAISIGSITSSGDISSFSSFGPTCWEEVSPFFDHPYPPGLMKPDVVGPGSSIISSTIGGGYGSNSGTSMASPHVTGIVALMCQVDPELTPEGIKAILREEAIDLGPAGMDSLYGAGKVDAYRIMQRMVGISSTLSGTCSPPCHISISPSNRSIHADSITGEYRIWLNPEITYSVVYERTGFYPETLEIYIPPDTEIIRDIELTPTPRVTFFYEVYLFETGVKIKYPYALIKEIDHPEYVGDTFGIIRFDTIPAYSRLNLSINMPGYASWHDTIYLTPTDEGAHYYAFLHKAIDFEADGGSFLISGGFAEDWEWGIPASGPYEARSGDKVWGTKLSEDYMNSSDSRLSTPYLYIPPGGKPLLSFYHWYNTETTDWGFWDGGNVSVTFDEWDYQVIYPLEGYDGVIDEYNTSLGLEPAFSGSTGGDFWHEEIFDLSEYEDTTISITFHFGSDDNTTRPGWYIDDVSIILHSIRGPMIYYEQTDTSVEISEPYDVKCRILPVSFPLDIARQFVIWSTDSLFSTSDTSFLLPFTVDSLSCPVTSPSEITTVYFYLQSWDSEDLHTNYPSDAPEHFFTFSVGSDTIPPLIELTDKPYKRTMNLTGSYYVKARITDNWLLDTSSVALTWTKNRGPEHEIPFEYLESEQFVFLINTTVDIGDIFEFYISVRDKATPPNSTVLPEGDCFIFEVVCNLFWDFETDSAFSSVNGIWQWGEPLTHPSAYSGSYCWGTIIDSYYPASSFDILSLPKLILGGFEHASLSFWHWYEFEEGDAPFHDGGNVWIATNRDTLLLTPAGGYDGICDSSNAYLAGMEVFSGLNGSWGNVAFDLTPFIGEEINILFYFASNPSFEDDGWFIDDVKIDTNLVYIKDNLLNLPKTLALYPNYPNPFNGNTRIDFEVPDNNKIRISIFDIQGREIKVLEYGRILQGRHSIYWDGTSNSEKKVSSGIYFVQLVSENKRIVNKMLYLK
ncbi:S8 family serine peptidase [bacterium]|nr:S8 family serine peptidase [bacterium]